MRKTTISRKAPKDHGPMSKAEWVALDALSEADIVAAALTDPDNPPMTKAQRARLRPVSHAKKIRWALRLTQQQFATKFGIPLGTLRDWEQHKVAPDAAARVLLKIIAMEPDVAAKAAKRQVA